ncbi:MAG: FIST N-terminal domain-containing protein [Polyangiaceae bacterium]
METKVVTAHGTGDAAQATEQVIATIRASCSTSGPTLILLFASTQQSLGEVATKTQQAFPSATVLGASTAGEFTEKGDAKGSLAAVAIEGDFKVAAGIAEGLRANAESAVVRALADIPSEMPGYPYRTALLLVDPLAGNGEEATLIAAAILGEGVKLAGGAAGDDLKMERTEISLGATVHSDAFALAVLFTQSPLGIGVCHGHKPLSGPLRITRAAGAVVHEIDGRPAWDVWREQTSEHATSHGFAELDADREGAYFLTYEAALTTGDELKIRAPLSRDAQGAISFACGIPEGAVIRITESTSKRQVESAREAARRASAQLGGQPVAGAIVFDCICRNLILGEDFGAAVRAMSAELGGAPLAGFETYGEIALDVGDMSGFHNTTSVVLAFPRC